MKKHYLFILFTFLFVTGFSQSTYLTNTNRVVLSTVINSDTIIIESAINKVRINGELDLLEIEYDNSNARLVSANDKHDIESDFKLRFYNTYAWLDERIKTTQKSIEFTDEINIEANGFTKILPVNFMINRLRGAQGFSVLIKMKGKFHPNDIDEYFPKLKFETDLYYSIYLTVQVIN